MNKIAEFTDYTNDQRTKGKDGKAVSKDFNFNEAVKRTGDPKAAADEYLKWCADNGYTPKFDEFKKEFIKQNQKTMPGMTNRGEQLYKRIYDTLVSLYKF
jgi:hypothetical protein